MFCAGKMARLRSWPEAAQATPAAARERAIKPRVLRSWRSISEVRLEIDEEEDLGVRLGERVDVLLDHQGSAGGAAQGPAGPGLHAEEVAAQLRIERVTDVRHREP